MSKKEEQPDRLKQFISWVDGDREPKDRTLFVMEQRPHREFRPSEEEFERREKDRLRKFFNWYPIAAAVICVALGIILFTTVMNMPGFGQEDNPINNEVAERYLEHSEEETGSENVVTAMIIGYRGPGPKAAENRISPAPRIVPPENPPPGDVSPFSST